MTRPSPVTPGGKLIDAIAPTIMALGVRLTARLPGLSSITRVLYEPDKASVEYGLRVARTLGVGVTLTQSRAGEVCVELDLDTDVVSEMDAKAVDL